MDMFWFCLLLPCILYTKHFFSRIQREIAVACNVMCRTLTPNMPVCIDANRHKAKLDTKRNGLNVTNS